ncbi:hypothetical protein GT755_29365 [Herbidospora sp. NEAU-GS84]|uniref:YCII-related domain-containing protein n=1 Tax=Herbidospora solisilvae TaxID=2696284 RepID=A0A7C9NKV7_9ACTN|nr:YciI family protein [Herbidospora solisilvae]NAS25778.1 hypothetical protein [Herbidospora solisilvae]
MTDPVTDDDMRRALAGTKAYTLVILSAGPEYGSAEAPALVWEHGRRNFALRAEGVLNIVCPVTDDTTTCGVGILDTDLETAHRIMSEDPGVKAGVFTFALHPVRSFPGDRLA